MPKFFMLGVSLGGLKGSQLYGALTAVALLLESDQSERLKVGSFGFRGSFVGVRACFWFNI
jgi:hypothetical protein